MKPWGPFLTSSLGRNFDPGGGFVPPREWSYPLCVKFFVHSSILLNSRECSTLGWTFPLGAKFTPRGEGKNGAVDIASAWGTEEPGSNPARVLGFYGNIAVLQCIIDLRCIVCVWEICKGVNRKKYFLNDKVTSNPKHQFILQTHRVTYNYIRLLQGTRCVCEKNLFQTIFVKVALILPKRRGQCYLWFFSPKMWVKNLITTLIPGLLLAIFSVTRLGEFSPNGRLFTSGISVNITKEVLIFPR
jgi:hypothetical protein